uniref:Uncharacterized protein n=2 Tax=Nothobranchius kadleci TaxID=1051664 RepID=A0A1A8CY51_NOTKA
METDCGTRVSRPTSSGQKARSKVEPRRAAIRTRPALGVQLASSKYFTGSRGLDQTGHVPGLEQAVEKCGRAPDGRCSGCPNETHQVPIDNQPEDDYKGRHRRRREGADVRSRCGLESAEERDHDPIP